MSRFVRVNGSDYKIKVNPGGSIILDTGNQLGSVTVTGDLLVLGNTTTVESETMTIKDNIIVVNSGETGVGITLETAGLRVDRGDLPDADIIFDENITWLSPTIALANGAFTLVDQLGNLIGLKTNSIITGGGDLFLINEGTGVLSVAGTVDYENNVVDDDHIPNKKFVDDQVAFLLSILPVPITDRIGEEDTTLIINDFEDDGNPSSLELKIDNNLIARWDYQWHDLYDLRFRGSTIQSTASNTDLILTSPGIGSVAIDDNLKLLKISTDPFFSSDGSKLFSKISQANDSGVFFVSNENRRGELCSVRKALAFSIIF
jgi:hypothetical protein